MRVKIFISILILYLINATVFIISIAKITMEFSTIEIWRDIPIFLLLLTILIFKGYKRDKCIQRMTSIALIILLGTFFAMILNSIYGDKIDWYYILLIFYVSNIAASVFVLEYSNRKT